MYLNILIEIYLMSETNKLRLCIRKSDMRNISTKNEQFGILLHFGIFVLEALWDSIHIIAHKNL